MPSTLNDDDLIDRQHAVTDAGMGAIAVQWRHAQRWMLEAPLVTARLTVLAIADLTRSIVKAALELSDRGVTTSTRSVEQLSRTLAADTSSGRDGDKMSSAARKAKDTVAA